MELGFRTRAVCSERKEREGEEGGGGMQEQRADTVYGGERVVNVLRLGRQQGGGAEGGCFRGHMAAVA
jgi:hypothetical protein